MKKTLLILGLIVVVLAIAFPILKRYTKSHSPAAEASYQNDGLSIKVNYCQPLVKGRLIFGEKSAGALQPYGEYWRVGANEATTFETNGNVSISGKELKAGKYAMYAIPGKTTWTIAFNSNWDRWGFTAPDPAKDVLRVDVPANNGANPKESFEISFENPDSAGTARMDLHWDKTFLRIPFQKK